MIGLALIACIAISLVGFAGRSHWLVDLTNHFKVQYLFCCTVACVWFVLRRRFGWLALAMSGIVLNGVLIAPLFISPVSRDANTTEVASHAKSDASAKLRVFAANVYVGNDRTEELLRQITHEAPHVVLISEFSDSWNELLLPLEANFPYSKKVPNNGAFGMAVYSRLPFDEIDVPTTHPMTPTIAARFTVDDKTITLISAHPVPPTSRRYAANRNAQLSLFGEFVAKLEGNVVLCGDLNTTRWSPWFSELTSNGLRDGVEGFGLRTTWPVKPNGFNHWLKQIQIDHCLVSKTVTVNDFRIGQPTGSDHLPIVIDLSF